MSIESPPVTSNSVDRPYPPVAWLSTGALCLVIIGGILMASYAAASGAVQRDGSSARMRQCAAVGVGDLTRTLEGVLAPDVRQRI